MARTPLRDSLDGGTINLDDYRRRRRVRRRILWSLRLLPLCAAVMGVAFALGSQQNHLTKRVARPALAAKPVRVVKVRHGPIRVSVSATGQYNCLSTMALIDDQGSWGYGGTEDCMHSGQLVPAGGSFVLRPVSPAPGHWTPLNGGWAASLPESDTFVSLVATGWSGTVTCEIQVPGQKPIVDRDDEITDPSVDCEYPAF